MILIHKLVGFAPNLLEVDRSLPLGIRLLILGMLVHIHLASCSTQLAQFHQHLVLFYGSCHILLLLRGSLAQQSKHMLLSLISFLLHQVENHVKLIFLICLENRNQLSFLLQLALGVFVSFRFFNCFRDCFNIVSILNTDYLPSVCFVTIFYTFRE